MSNPICLDWQGDLATVILNQPERANVLDEPASLALCEIALFQAARAL